MANITKSDKNVSRIDPEPDRLEIGQWFWVETKNYKGEIERWLGCVTHIGSNYAELSSVGGRDSRVHFDEFNTVCTPEPEAERIIAENIEKYKAEAVQLMGRVQELTRQLAIPVRHGLSDGAQETQALSLRGNSRPVEDYKQDLILAKDETLPGLFEKIKKANEYMAMWMQAPLLALQAGLKALEPAISMIKDRIFNVELYAGLVEQVEQLTDGEPAAISEPIHLFQRRAYMDEECLANYQVGGMEFKDLKQFDKWLVKPENRDRLLPHSRCVLAFQVRRDEKIRDAVSFREFIQITLSGVKDYDKLTFLYIRNGDRIYRLNTAVEFGSRLFPDFDQSILNGVVYGKRFIKIESIISEAHYLAIVEQEKREKKEYKRKVREAKKEGKDPFFISSPHITSHDYILWSPDSVYYDDIAAYIKKQTDHHNRIVLVLQGLLDRSPVFHPHPPWHLWEPEEFSQALELVFDDSRGLVAGAAPDFEAYRARLNESITVGSVTVGQEDFWEQTEAQRENRRRANDWRRKTDYYELKRYRPYGNPGPGRLAKVVKVNRKGECSFEWQRQRQTYSRWGNDTPIKCSLSVPSKDLLHVDAYRAGDFKQFFNDPRTRAQYLKWAPLLLTCEEFLAGNINVDQQSKKP